jgi:hypothetical protein
MPMAKTIIFRIILNMSFIGIRHIPTQIKMRGHNLTISFHEKDKMFNVFNNNKTPMAISNMPQ